MENFSEFIEELNLIDLLLEGGSYTRSIGSDQPSMSRIDRALVSHDWEDHYLNVIQRVLLRPISDHFLILVKVRRILRGKSSFRFENMWLKTDGFTERVSFLVESILLLKYSQFCACQEVEGCERRHYSMEP